ncbi:MAG: hypothetical protein FJX75_05990 [Armatimonadetes bacterium]|nr:hypothetical protein [Armatimonadota bacterium]
MTLGPDAPGVTTPQINLGPALAVPLATAPAVGASANVTRLNKLQNEANQPSTVAELKTELNFWVSAANTNPNDSAAQLGLSLAIATAASQNAAHAVGESMFGTTRVMDVAALGVGPKLRPQRLMSDALAALTSARVPPARGTAASDSAATTATDLKNYRAAIQNYVLSPLENVQDRLMAIADGAAVTKKLFTLKIDGSPGTVYSADFRAVGAVFELVRCALLMATSVNPDYGTYDWNLDLVQRDANKDSKLTVAEYAPAAPFGNVTAATWTQAGGVLREAVADMNQALADMREDDAEVLQRALAGMGDPTGFEANLADAATMLNGQVNVSVYTESAAGMDASEALTKVPLNLRELWDTPPASLRGLLPPLYLGLDYGQYATVGGPLFEMEFRRPLAESGSYQVAQPAPWVARTTTMATSAAPHPINVAAGSGFPGINGSFNWNWKQFKGTWGSTAVTATCAYPELKGLHKWSELPDPTISGVFPNTTKVKTLMYGDYDRVIVRYRSIVVGDTES